MVKWRIKAIREFMECISKIDVNNNESMFLMFDLFKDIELCLKGKYVEFIEWIFTNHIN